MALNFPDNPSVNDIYRDSTSGFAYQWDGVVWQSYSDSSLGQIKVLDDISGSFNGSTQTFALTSNSTAVTPANAQQVRVVLGGVVQDPANDYTVSGSNITFTTPPAGALSFSGIVFGTAVPINTVLDGSVTPVKLSTGGPTWNTSGDVNIAGIVTATSASIGYDNVGINSSGINVAGVITSTSFVGDVTGTASTATASGVSYGLEGTPNINVGIVTATSGVQVSGIVTARVGHAVTFYGGVNISNAVETVSIGATYDLGGGLVILECDAQNATVFTHNLSNGTVGIVSLRNFPATKNSAITYTIIFDQLSSIPVGVGNTTVQSGIGTNITLTPLGLSGFTTSARVSTASTVTLSATASDIDIVTLAVHYNGSGTGSVENYRVFVTNNSGYRFGTIGF